MENKRIVICCDGTWNEPEQLDEDNRIYPTNVLKMVRAISTSDPQSGKHQLVYYQTGIGSAGTGFISRYISRMLCGLTGLGIANNIQACYRFLANNYSDGDEIYLFGFSRGAYTARSLAGMIGSMGLLQKQDMDKLPRLYAHYKTAPDRREKSKYADIVNILPRRHVKIKFIGVWDTVGALGLPVQGVQHLSRRWVGFHNTHLGSHIENAYHAVSIDEQRRPFKPSMWTRLDGQEDCQQMWFVGSHSNIGGGLQDHGLSDIALTWLANRARNKGLNLDAAYFSARDYIKPRADAPIFQSLSWPYRLLSIFGLGRYRRPIGVPANVAEMIHESVIERVLNDSNYRPASIFPSGRNAFPLVTYIHNRNMITIAGKEIPVFRERQWTRIEPEEPQAMLEDDTGHIQQCEIVDFSGEGGAQVKLKEEISAGSNVILDNPEIGYRQATVVWAEKRFAGLKYA